MYIYCVLDSNIHIFATTQRIASIKFGLSIIVIKGHQMGEGLQPQNPPKTEIKKKEQIL